MLTSLVASDTPSANSANCQPSESEFVHDDIRLHRAPQVRPADPRCAPGVTVKWWRKRAFVIAGQPRADLFVRDNFGDDLDVQRTPGLVLYLRDDGRTWWDTREDSSLLCAVGRKWMSVEDTKAAVRRFTQALDSNNLSILPEICTPACADTWSQGINSDPGATITLISAS